MGKSATANRLEEVDLQIKRYKSRQGPSPFPLTHCPWCGTELGPDSLTVFRLGVWDEYNVAVSRRVWMRYGWPGLHEDLEDRS